MPTTAIRHNRRTDRHVYVRPTVRPLPRRTADAGLAGTTAW
jgi:hypothetical protein